MRKTLSFRTWNPAIGLGLAMVAAVPALAQTGGTSPLGPSNSEASAYIYNRAGDVAASEDNKSAAAANAAAVATLNSTANSATIPNSGGQPKVEASAGVSAGNGAISQSELDYAFRLSGPDDGTQVAVMTITGQYFISSTFGSYGDLLPSSTGSAGLFVCSSVCFAAPNTLMGYVNYGTGDGEAHDYSLQVAIYTNTTYYLSMGAAARVNNYNGTTGLGAEAWIDPLMTFTLADPNGDPSQFKFAYSDGVYPAAVSGGVPEPAAWALLIGGFGCIGAVARRRRARAATV